jgi:putative transposase
VTEGLLPHLPRFIPHGRNGAPITAPALSLEQLDHALKQFIVKEYNKQKHSETQQMPIERWARGGWIPRMPGSDESLDLLLTVTTARQVYRDGIHFQGIRYLSLTLSAYVGEVVTLRYNPRDMAEIRVYLQNAFLCSAITPELSSGAISLKPDVTSGTRTAVERRGSGTLADHGRELISERLNAGFAVARRMGPGSAGAGWIPQLSPIVHQ